jgi:hypothetical protein
MEPSSVFTSQSVTRRTSLTMLLFLFFLTRSGFCNSHGFSNQTVVRIRLAIIMNLNSYKFSASLKHFSVKINSLFWSDWQNSAFNFGIETARSVEVTYQNMQEGSCFINKK